MENKRAEKIQRKNWDKDEKHSKYVEKMYKSTIKEHQEKHVGSKRKAIDRKLTKTEAFNFQTEKRAKIYGDDQEPKEDYVPLWK